MTASHRSTAVKLMAGTCLHRESPGGRLLRSLDKRKLQLRQSAIKPQRRRQKNVAIPCGANHGWANPGQERARLAVVLIDGKLKLKPKPKPKCGGSVSGAEMAP